MVLKEFNEKKKKTIKDSDVYYETIEATNFLFGKLSPEDLEMDPLHDKHVKKATKKYEFNDMGKMNIRESINPKNGIVDEKSAKKILGGQLNQKFVIIREPPTFYKNEKQWQNMIINIVITTDTLDGPIQKLVPVRISSVIDILPYEARVAIMSNIVHQCSLRKNKLSEIILPSKYARYNVLAGADLANATEEDLEEMKNNDALIKGWLYGRKTWNLEYAPEKLADATFFFENESALNTDCLIHAVNYALRYPFFV